MIDSRLSKLINKFAQQAASSTIPDDLIKTVEDDDTELSKTLQNLNNEMAQEKESINKQLDNDLAAKYPKLKLKYDQYKNHDTDEEFTPEEVKILESYRLKKYELEEQLEKRHEKDRKQQREFDDQDDEINQFQQTENDNKLTLVKSREGKTPFSQQDTTTIVNSLLPSIKSSLTAQKLLPTTLNFTFNTAVTASSTNPKVAALLRRDFQMPLELAFKHYLITNKKYLSAPVTLSISA